MYRECNIRPKQIRGKKLPDKTTTVALYYQNMFGSMRVYSSFSFKSNEEHRRTNGQTNTPQSIALLVEVKNYNTDLKKYRLSLILCKVSQ